MKFLTVQFYPVYSYFLHVNPSVFLSFLFSKGLSLLSYLNVRDQVSYPHKTADEIIFLYILIFVLFESKWEG